jgi:hypothetical protein
VYNTRSENCTEVFPEGSTYGNTFEGNTFVRKYLSCTVSWKVRKYLRKLLVTVNKYFRTIFILKVLSYLRTKVRKYCTKVRKYFRTNYESTLYFRKYFRTFVLSKVIPPNVHYKCTLSTRTSHVLYFRKYTATRCVLPVSENTWEKTTNCNRELQSVYNFPPRRSSELVYASGSSYTATIE